MIEWNKINRGVEWSLSQFQRVFLVLGTNRRELHRIRIEITLAAFWFRDNTYVSKNAWAVGTSNGKRKIRFWKKFYPRISLIRDVVTFNFSLLLLVVTIKIFNASLTCRRNNRMYWKWFHSVIIFLYYNISSLYSIVTFLHYIFILCVIIFLWIRMKCKYRFVFPIERYNITKYNYKIVCIKYIDSSYL